MTILFVRTWIVDLLCQYGLAPDGHVSVHFPVGQPCELLWHDEIVWSNPAERQVHSKVHPSQDETAGPERQGASHIWKMTEENEKDYVVHGSYGIMYS